MTLLWLGEGHLRDTRTSRTPAIGAKLGARLGGALSGTACLDRARSRRGGSSLFCLLSCGLRHLGGLRHLRGHAAVRRAQAAIGSCLLRCRLGGRGLACERLLEPANDRRLDRR